MELNIPAISLKVNLNSLHGPVYKTPQKVIFKGFHSHPMLVYGKGDSMKMKMNGCDLSSKE